MIDDTNGMNGGFSAPPPQVQVMEPPLLQPEMTPQIQVDGAAVDESWEDDWRDESWDDSRRASAASSKRDVDTLSPGGRQRTSSSSISRSGTIRKNINR